MKKQLLIVLAVLVFMPIVLSAQGKIHIWTEVSDKDYSWTNQLVQELRNSKYHNQFGNYTVSGEWDGIKENDYIIICFLSVDGNSYYGSYSLYKVKWVDGRLELLYRASASFIYSFNRQMHWVNWSKNNIYKWIDDGKMNY
jgi:hypothetical protein